MLARDFSKSIHTATLAALFLAFSPVFVLYGGQVMTDVPSVLLLCVALGGPLPRSATRACGWSSRGRPAGLGVNLRETMGFYAPWLVVAPSLWLETSPASNSNSPHFVSGVLSLRLPAGLRLVHHG